MEQLTQQLTYDRITISFKREVNRFYKNEGQAPTRQPCRTVFLLL